MGRPRSTRSADTSTQHSLSTSDRRLVFSGPLTPTPTPTPALTTDFLIQSLVASPDPVGSGQAVSFTVNAFTPTGPGINPTISIVLPSGVSFSACSPNCTPPGTPNGGTVTANFNNVAAG